MPSMRLDRTSGGRARLYPPALPACPSSPHSCAPRVPTDLPHAPPVQSLRPSLDFPWDTPLPRLPQLRLLMAFLGPQDR